MSFWDYYMYKIRMGLKSSPITKNCPIWSPCKKLDREKQFKMKNVTIFKLKMEMN